MKILNKQSYLKIKQEAYSAYLNSINEFVDHYKNFQSIDDLIFLISKNESLKDKKNYELGLYFLSELYKLVNYIEPLVELENGEVEQEEVEEFLFEEFTSTQYGEYFLKEKKKSEDIIEASNQTIKHIHKFLLAFFNIHFLGANRIDYPYYQDIFEIADRYTVNSINSFKIKDIDFELYLFTDDFSKQSKRISIAINAIKTYSPSSYERLIEFTKYITVLNDAGLVSYSSQYLPGYSSINLYDRDDLDLVDDLLHENGHHHLNHYLNHIELINEDDEQIYYSPWRKALRPIRGIYHAVFTFYFAFKIYHDLLNSDFYTDSAQKYKITKRFIEERNMLLFCRTDLEHAYENDKITEEGKILIDEIYKEIDAEKDNITNNQESLVENDEELNNLREALLIHSTNKAY